MANHTFSLKVNGDADSVSDLADRLYRSAVYIPDISVDGNIISVSGEYKRLDLVLRPFLHLVELVGVWFVDHDDAPPEYWRIANGVIEWCGIAPNEHWIELERSYVQV